MALLCGGRLRMPPARVRGQLECCCSCRYVCQRKVFSGRSAEFTIAPGVTKLSLHTTLKSAPACEGPFYNSSFDPDFEKGTG